MVHRCAAIVRAVVLITAVLLVALPVAMAPASQSAVAAKKHRPICTKHHKRHCIHVPKGVGKPHRNQDAAGGPKLSVSQAPDGLGADQTGTQGAVDWAYQHLGDQSYDGWCGKFVAHAFGVPALGYATAWQAAVAFGLHGGTPPPGSLVFFVRQSTNGYAGHIGIALPGDRMISAQSNGVRIASLDTPYWRALYAGWSPPPASWPGRAPNGAAPPLFPPPPPPPPPTDPGTTAGPGVDRQAITSYDRMTGGAPFHGYFDNAWQPFNAGSNTITSIGVTVGNPNRSPGAPAPETLTVRLCSGQPDANGSCPGQIAETHPQIVNYGNTAADIGDVAVTPGQTYWVVWYQPPPVGGATWVTYWWAGGSTISSSDQMQMVVKGYNR